jgi:NitT/TauT family transport system permease protein
MALCVAFIVQRVLPNVGSNQIVSQYYPMALGIAALAYACALLAACFLPKLRAKLHHLAGILTAFIILIGLYDLATLKSGALPSMFMPSPENILEVYATDYPLLLVHLAGSLRLLLVGITWGAVTGVITGIVMGWSYHCNYWLSPLLKCIGPVPAAAWLPIAMIAMPTSFAAGVFLISLAVWFPISLNVSSAIRNTSTQIIDTARVMGASNPYTLLHVAIPAALPAFFTGLFLGVSSSFGALVVAEMLGVESGLGWYIIWSQSFGRYDQIYATTVIFAILFFFLIDILFRVRGRILKWQRGLIRW